MFASVIPRFMSLKLFTRGTLLVSHISRSFWSHHLSLECFLLLTSNSIACDCRD